MMASNGAVVKALDLFSVCLAYLGDKAMECINASGQRAKTYESRDVQWVVTVPAIWEPTAKEFMREAAYKVRKKPLTLITFYFDLLLRFASDITQVKLILL